jgi:hypothetical protein
LQGGRRATIIDLRAQQHIEAGRAISKRGGQLVIVKRGGLIALAAAACWIGWGSTGHADWAGCQKKPTRDCLLEEAFRGDNGPLTGKDRLDVLLQGGALVHPEYLTAADIAEAERLARSTPSREVASVYYARLAIQGLVATNQKQQAIDLVASFSGGLQAISINEIVRDLVKADDLETALALPDRMHPPIASTMLYSTRNDIVVAAVKALAEIGKTDRAQMLMTDQKYPVEYQMADMQIALGQAFAKRGDAKLAQLAFDQAERNLDAARRYNIGPKPALRFRFESIRVLAFRGQADAVSAALEQIRSATGFSDVSTDYERSQGYQGVGRALLEVRQPEAALSIAKSITPESIKDAVLRDIATWAAMNGRRADALAALALLSKGQESARGAVDRALAIAAAKEGDVAPALRLVGEIHDPMNSRGILFAIAQVLPY